MKQILVDLKNNLLSRYTTHLKPHVDKSIKRIEETGSGKFVVDSMRGFSIWVATCLVYLYTHLQIYYEKYRLSEQANNTQTVTANDQTGETLSSGVTNIKIYKYWNQKQRNVTEVNGICVDEYLTQLVKQQTKHDDDDDDDNETDTDTVVWYTLFTDGPRDGILVADPFSEDFQERLKIKKSNDKKYLSAIKKSTQNDTSDDIIDFISKYTRVEGNKDLETRLLAYPDGTPIYTHDDDILQLIDNDVNSYELSINDVLHN